MRTPCARRLLVFARNPVPGRVKTRLIPVLGRAAATALYREMLRSTLATAARVADASTEIWLDSADRSPAILSMAREFDMSLRTQSGTDLGRRMATAFADTAHHGDHVVLIGSDCPGFSAAYLESAFAALADHDVVIGPAADGGYVLIGMSAPRARLFDDIPWSTDQVLHATRRRLRGLGLFWQELETLHDLDRPEDLTRFPALAAQAGVARVCRDIR